MRRLLTIVAATGSLVVGSVALGVAQEGTEQATNALGTPCATPEALVIASPGLTMLATPEIEFEGTPVGEPGATPGALDETRIDAPECPSEQATPAP